MYRSRNQGLVKKSQTHSIWIPNIGPLQLGYVHSLYKRPCWSLVVSPHSTYFLQWHPQKIYYMAMWLLICCFSCGYMLCCIRFMYELMFLPLLCLYWVHHVTICIHISLLQPKWREKKKSFSFDGIDRKVTFK